MGHPWSHINRTIRQHLPRQGSENSVEASQATIEGHYFHHGRWKTKATKIPRFISFCTAPRIMACLKTIMISKMFPSIPAWKLKAEKDNCFDSKCRTNPEKVWGMSLESSIPIQDARIIKAENLALPSMSSVSLFSFQTSLLLHAIPPPFNIVNGHVAPF